MTNEKLERVVYSTSRKERTLKTGDIIEKVQFVRTEKTRGQIVYIFAPEGFNDVKGILFPNDNIVYLGEDYNAIINNIIQKEKGRLALSEVYHYDEELFSRKSLPIIVSCISHEGHPMFKLRGKPRDYRGFIDNKNLKVGDKAIVKIGLIERGNSIEKFLKARLVSLIK